MAPFEKAMVVSYRLSIVTIAISNHSAAICHQISLTSNISDAQIDRG